MSEKEIKLGKVHIPLLEYASQGNGILGIRDSGKTYTATYLAEQIMKAGIPIVAFTPIGIWPWLRVGRDGKKGFPIVVAGGKSGDLPLTPQSAPDIVRSAMRENVSLVIDLYDIHLSKADWSRIVESSLHVLLYENEDYGLRHIFLEEAAEFCPQMIRDNHAKVYAEVEKLARMGGNSRLGYTLINQRAEEVNKAVLELCDCLFLHRQKGRNSLTALGKWLDVGDVTEHKEIVKSLPKLAQGECWIWTAGSDSPERVKIPQKATVHPDRRAMHQTVDKRASRMDVSAFVAQMSKSLEKHLQESKDNDPAEIKRQLAAALKRIAELEKLPTVAAPVIETKIVQVPVFQGREVETLTESMQSLNSSAELIMAALNQATAKMKLASNGHAPKPVIRSSPVAQVKMIERPSAPVSGESVKIAVGEKKTLQVIAQYSEGAEPGLIALITGLRLASVETYISRLQKKGYVAKDKTATHEGIDALGDDYELLPSGADLQDYWRTRLGGGELALFSLALQHGGEWINDSDAEKWLGVYTASSIKTYQTRLKARKIIEQRPGAYRAAPGLF